MADRGEAALVIPGRASSCEAGMHAPLTGVIARLDRGTRYSALAVIHAGVYRVPAFAGMTNVCAVTARPS